MVHSQAGATLMHCKAFVGTRGGSQLFLGSWQHVSKSSFLPVKLYWQAIAYRGVPVASLTPDEQSAASTLHVRPLYAPLHSHLFRTHVPTLLQLRFCDGSSQKLHGSQDCEAAGRRLAGHRASLVLLPKLSLHRRQSCFVFSIRTFTTSQPTQ